MQALRTALRCFEKLKSELPGDESAESATSDSSSEAGSRAPTEIGE